MYAEHEIVEDLSLILLKQTVLFASRFRYVLILQHRYAVSAHRYHFQPEKIVKLLVK